MSIERELAEALRMVLPAARSFRIKIEDHEYDRATAALAKFTEAERVEPVEAEPVWRTIESAPVNTAVRIKVGGMTFQARLIPDGSMSDMDTSCDQWVAEIEGEHPPCWSEGCCWASNENDDRSLQPEAWSALPTPPQVEVGK